MQPTDMLMIHNHIIPFMYILRTNIVIGIISKKSRVCVLSGLRNKQYGRIMRCWCSKPQSVIAQSLDSVAYCFVLYPEPP